MNPIINQIGSAIAGTDQNFLKSIPKMIGGLSTGDKRLIMGAGAAVAGGELVSRSVGQESAPGQVASVGSKIAGLAAVSFVGKDLIGSVATHSPLYMKHRGQEIAKGVTQAISSTGRAAGRGSSIMNLAEKVARGSAALM
jgi:hypothetical protein